LTVPLDETLWTKLDDLSRRFQQPMAEVVRQMIAQQTLEHFPQSWRLAAEEQQKTGLLEALLRDAPDGCTLLVDLGSPVASTSDRPRLTAPREEPHDV
jgi:predicted transcriptional regulator